MTTTWRNWSGSVEARPVRIARPRTVDDVAAAVKDAVRDGLRVKPIGSGHSFSPIAVADGVQLVLAGQERPVEIDTATGLVTVPGGMPLHRLNPLLAEHGLAMENLGDIDRQTIAGATSTSTHGTGVGFGSIATQLRGLELVLADGSMVRCSADERPELFELARVGLGALGVVTAVTLQTVPSFALQAVEEPMPLDQVLDGIDELVDGNDHFEFYWFPHTRTALTKRQTRLPGDSELRPLSRWRSWLDDDLITNIGFEGLLRFGTRFPRAIPAITRGVTRSLSRREFTDLSHKVLASRRDVRFNEGEYAFAREHVVDVLREIQRWVDGHDEKISFPLEIRFVNGDDIPMAPTYRRTSAYVAFHQYHRMSYRPYFDALEDIFAGVDGRPHWGKMHRLDASALRQRYDRFDDFVALRNQLDPIGVFGNDYLDRTLGVPGAV
jgi:FAD-linked oxidoreductase